MFCIPLKTLLYFCLKAFFHVYEECFCIFLFLFAILHFEVIFLTNINCTSNCIYQKDGKCGYELIDTGKISCVSDCAYFVACQRK